MRIVCDGCGAKYQVDDNKVLNRSFKFPCKKCGEKIVVRQSEASESDSGRAEDEADQGAAFEATTQLNYDDHLAQQADDEGAVWYVAVGQERVGPVTANDVQSYIDQGQVAAASFVWCDGMDDWAPLEAVPALARLLPNEVESPVSANPFSEAASPYANEPVSSGPVDDDAGDLFVSEKREATFDEPPNSPVMSTAQLTGQRHENSVLFSLDSLDNDQVAQSSMMAPSATANTEASGLIDLAMLTGDGDNLDSIFSQGAPSAAPMGAPIKPMASLVTQPRNNRIGLIIAVVAILVAGLTGGVVWFLLKPQQNQSTVVTSAPPVTPATPIAKIVPQAPPKQVIAPTKPALAAAPADAKPVDKVSAEEKGTAETAAKTSTKSVAAQAKPKKKSSWRKKSPRSRKRKSVAKKAAQKPLALPTPKPKRKAKASGDAAALLASLDGGGKKSSKSGGGLPSMDAPAVDPTLPERLDRGQVLRAIRRHFSKVKDCRRLEPDISGQVTVRFTVNGNGRVSGTKTTGQYANTPIGNCVAQKVRAIRFPRFSGTPFPINFPFSL